MQRFTFLVIAVILSLSLNAQSTYEIPENVASGLKIRNVGPATTSGRVSDLAMNPNNPAEYFVAVASGGVWKTNNFGTTFSPIFDGESSYSIGCISLAPSNPNIVWVGTGENNNQRSVAYGDGVYKSEDGGKSFKNMGLKSSEHIGKIWIDPSNSERVIVAAYGPLWSAGGERGLYESTNGGESWKRILYVDQHTGFSDLIVDPSNSDIMYAAAHQRRRHVWTYIGGGPGSAIYKSTDGGKSWETLESGLPTGKMGRIGLGISAAAPNRVYAIVEAMFDKSGLYRSDDYGVSWNKVNDYKTSGNYYQEIVCDQQNPDRLFFMDTWLHHSDDGGHTVKRTGETGKHVDNHAMWIDPLNPDHWIVGCDGGLYETWTAAKEWQFKPNLPITQFYKVAVDNDKPFYNIYGGTQDNNTIGGPSQTLNNAGILNSDWFITNGGDGFEAQVDPLNPNIVYSQSQYGWLVRYDKATGERVGIKPQPEEGEELIWNWDAPLLISPHLNTRLYFAANKLFRSDDRGNTWRAVSPDLTKQLDRNKIPVMDRVWSIDAVMKNRSTTIFGNIVALDEAKLKEGLLYVGTDDGLIQVSDNFGSKWRKISKIKGVPEGTYVNQLVSSHHKANRVYAVFNNHKNGDFKPYVFRSDNAGKSWTNISSNLPTRGSTYSIAEDHVNPNLLFVGTEFGVFASADGGAHWTQLKNGLPTIAIRDLAIQERENDLVMASFGRGFYVLDDYSVLRDLPSAALNRDAFMAVADTQTVYIESNPLGLRGTGSQGASFYAAPNPEVGARIMYHVKNKLSSLEDQRQDAEAKKRKNKENIYYPSFEDLENEALETDPYLLFIIRDDKGEVVRKLKTGSSSGLNSIVWDGRYASTTPINPNPSPPGRYSSPDVGPLALPGSYTVELHQYQLGELKLLVPATAFVLAHLDHQTIKVEDKDALVAFQKQVGELRRSIRGSGKLISETEKRLKHVRYAVEHYPTTDLEMLKEIEKVEKELFEIEKAMYGDGIKSTHQFATTPGVSSRIETVVWSTWNAVASPTELHKKEYSIALRGYEELIGRIHTCMDQVSAMEEKLDLAKSPYTPGRDTKWKDE